PDNGTIEVLGRPHLESGVSDRIGYLPEERGLYKKMQVRRVLRFLAELKGVSGADADRRIDEWMERLALRTAEKDWGTAKVNELSRGMQQKVQFIGTLLHDPEFIVLDEPFSGLDPVNSLVMRETVVDLARSGHTVLFSTHIMEQAEQLCDRIVIIARGEKVVDGAVRDVKREAGTRELRVVVTSGQDAARRVLEDPRWAPSLNDQGATWRAQLAAGVAPEDLLRTLVQSGAAVAEFAVEDPSLESIFIARVGAEAATAQRIEETHHA
ncbi:MAG TPA: ATP-binding cassette domain-containing protein, partial [Armatimonadota bacterium]|nr:ATP-binding cassette domain-containing protein [Armatimonadota bacterium]